MGILRGGNNRDQKGTYSNKALSSNITDWKVQDCMDVWKRVDTASKTQKTHRQSHISNQTLPKTIIVLPPNIILSSFF